MTAKSNPLFEHPASPVTPLALRPREAAGNGQVQFGWLGLLDLRIPCAAGGVPRVDADATRTDPSAAAPPPPPTPPATVEQSAAGQFAATTIQSARENYLVPREVAARWSVCVDKVLNFIRSGELRAFNVAATTSKRPRYRISLLEVTRFEQETRAATPPHSVPTEPAGRRRSPLTRRPAGNNYF
jgi:hypothetical protein